METDIKLEKLKQEIYGKMQMEFLKFKENLIKQNPEVIMETSYEKVYKEEVVELFDPSYCNYNYEQLSALNKEEKPLSALYDGWMSCDIPIYEPFQENIYDELEDLILKQREDKQKKSREQER